MTPCDEIYIFCGVENDIQDGHTAFVKIGAGFSAEDAMSIANQMQDMIVARFGRPQHQPAVNKNIIPFKK